MTTEEISKTKKAGLPYLQPSFFIYSRSVVLTLPKTRYGTGKNKSYNLYAKN